MDKLSLSAQLILVKKQLEQQNEEMQIRAAELLIANRELAFQNEEKNNQSAELLLANIEIAFQNSEKKLRATELLIANEALLRQNEECQNKVQELADAYKQLLKAEKYMKEHILDLEEMMFITSHKVRKPVANILGLSDLLEEFICCPANLRQLVNHLKSSVSELDNFTRELTDYVSEMERKGKF